MKPELCLPNVIISFENLADLSVTLDEYIELHSKMATKFENRLGVLLRGSVEQGGGGANLQQIDSDADQRGKGKKNPSRRGGDSDDPDWVTLGNEEFSIRIASPRPDSIRNAEVSALFKAVEALKSKLVALEYVRKVLGELPTRGFRTDQRILVVFRDGVPKQIIPTAEAGKQLVKFRYSEQFQIAMLK